MAAGLHTHRNHTLPSLLSGYPPSSSHEQRVPGAGQEPPRTARRPACPLRSGAHRIIGLQNESTKGGILKNTSDYEEFWKLIQEEDGGTEVKQNLQNIKFKMSASKLRSVAAPRGRKTRLSVKADQRKETQVSSPESIACLPQTHRGSQQPTPRGLLSWLMEWKKKCEQRETAGKVAQGWEKNKILHKSAEKHSRSKNYLSCLYQMRSASLANMRFSRSLLEGDGRFADVDRARGLLDRLFPGGHRQRGVQPRETRREDSRPAGRQPAAPPPLSFLKCDSPASKKKDSNQKTRRHQAAPCGMVNLPEHKRGEAASPGMTTAPLTLEQAIQTHRVVEAKTARRYWTNYVD
ncbi:uncharacterized protein [Equus caballus]|uniref:uncharacterized protein isoform X1 n=1 Tax=Equus caballus TaxID=9796 RepID=UPI0038B26B30